MKSKKLISLLCAAALTVSSFAGLTITAGAADTSDTPILSLDFNSTANFAADSAAPDSKYDGVLANGTEDSEVTATILTDGTAVKTVADGQTAALTLVTTNRVRSSGSGDRGWYTDTANVLVKSGSYYEILTKAESDDNYLHMGFPHFGYFYAQGTLGRVNLPETYAADATKDYVLEFDAKFNTGLDGGKVGTESKFNPVLRIGTADMTAKTANAVEISKSALSIGDEWVHVKSVTSLKGTKVYLENSEVYSANSTTTKEVASLLLYSEDGQSTISPPLDVKGDSLNADKHTITPSVDIDNLKIYTADPEVEADVTITFKDADGTAVKDAVTLTGVVGKQFSVPVAYLASIDTDSDNYYKYASGADAFTVVDGENTVNLVFESTAKPTVTFEAVAGETTVATIGTAKAMPGTKTEAIYAQEYIQDEDGNWYQKVEVLGGPRGTYPTYDLTATAGDADSTVSVNYVPVRNVVSFMEAEDTDDTTDGTYSANYPKLYASGGQWVQSALNGNYPSGFMTEAVEAEGKYEVTLKYYTDKGRSAHIFKVADGAATSDGVEIGAITNTGLGVYTFSADLEAGDSIWVGKLADDGAKVIGDVDYIVVKKASATPAVAITSFAGNKATLTVTNADDVFENVNAKLIHASYADGALNSIKVYNAPLTIAGDAMGAEVEIPADDTVYKGDVLMVWDSLDGMKPLAAAPYTVTEGADVPVPSTSPDPSPSPSAEPTYTVTVDANIANGTVIADKTANVAAGETVTLTVTADNEYTIGEVKYNGTAITPDEGVYSFTMPAGDVTVTATFNQLPELTGTVNVTGTAKVSETLTAEVTGAPEGAALKYQWMRADAADGEYTAIENATTASRKLTTAAQGKYIKVVVTADGYRGSVESDPQGPVAEPDTPVLKYTVSSAVNPADTATVTLTANDAAIPADGVEEGEHVKVTATANAGYKVTGVTTDDTDTTVTPNADGTYSFDMPAKNVTVTVNTVAVYTVTIAANDNANITVTANDAAVPAEGVEEGAHVKVTATANAGYKVTGVTTDDADTTVTPNADGTYSFDMPAKGVTVTVNTVAVYTVTITANDNANITVKNGDAAVSTGDKVEVGTTLTIEASAKTGYNLTAVKADSTALTAGEDGKYTTTVTADVTISVETEAIPQPHTVTVSSNIVGGTVSTNAAADGVMKDTEVTVTATAYEDYTLSSVSYNDGTDHEITADNGVYKFMMPDAAVEVKATFTVRDNVYVATESAYIDEGEADNAKADRIRINKFSGKTSYAVMRFDLTSAFAKPVYSAALKLYPISCGNWTRSGNTTIGLVNGATWSSASTWNSSNTDITFDTTTTLNGSTSTIYGSAENFKEVDITNTVKAATAGEVSIAMKSDYASDISFAGAGDAQYAPRLVITPGVNVTLTTKLADTATAGVKVKIDNTDYTSDENGQIKLILLPGNHTYEVEAGTYEAVSSTQFTLTLGSDFTQDITLAKAALALDHVTIAEENVSTLQTGAQKTFTFTAKAYTQDNVEIEDATITWSIQNGDSNVATFTQANGVVTVPATAVSSDTATITAAATYNTVEKSDSKTVTIGAVALAARTPAADVADAATVYTIATESTEVDNRVALAVGDNKFNNIHDDWAVGTTLPSIDFDFKVSDGETISLGYGNSKSGGLDKQSATLNIVAAGGSITLNQTYGSNSNQKNQAMDSETITKALVSGNWYRMVIKTNTDLTSAVSIYELNQETGAIGDLAVTATLKNRSLVATTGTRMVAFGGSGYLDNLYVYQSPAAPEEG